MVKSNSLLRALPVSALEPDVVARLSVWNREDGERAPQSSIALLEPPCGQREAYLDPVEAIEVLRKSLALQVDAAEALADLRRHISPSRWVQYLDRLSPEAPGCIRVGDFVEVLRDARHLATSTIHFLETAAADAASKPMFEGPDNPGNPWSLESLPDQTPPKAMMEFLPGAAGGPWYFDIEWDWERGDWRQGFNPFAQWRDAIKPRAESLENAIGSPVYRFAGPGSDCEDDHVHRFLVLHWCCTYRPQSSYVQYLVRTSGARHVDELKGALLDPEFYGHDFEINDTFCGLEVTGALRLRYPCSSAHLPAAI